MCTTWSQDRWLKETAKEGSRYKLLGTHKNEKGNQALTVTDGELVRNVYSSDGWSEEYFSYQFVPETGEWRENIPHDEQVVLAQEAMAKRGYTTGIPAQADTAGVTLVEAQTEAPKQATDDGLVRVHGKTLAEWEREGELNEHRLPDEHVHPDRPKELGAVTDAWKAYVVSLTGDEAMLELMVLAGLGVPTDAVGAS